MERRHLLVAFLIGLAFVLVLNATAPTATAEGPASGNRAPRVAVGTAFTYQGRLNRGGSPATGYYDFRFILYNQLVGGSQVGPQIARDNVEVRNGLFTVLLDFGSVFDGTLLFLEVSVKDHSVIGHTTLTPRHALWAKPYAIYAVNAGTATAGPFWSLTGNSGTTPGANFVGTADNQPLEFKVANARALRLEYANNGLVNVVGGYSGNSVTSGAGAATICGGGDLNNTNRVTDYAGTVGGGTNNRAGDDASNTTNASYATVGGGNSNTAGSIQATVGGGAYNTVNLSATNATIGGGANNTASGSVATIGGGGGNTASNAFATVGGGDQSTASGTYSTIGGGYYNTAIGTYDTVGGGGNNSTDGDSATVAGGTSNTASGSNATVGGGHGNTANGPHTTVPGGLEAHAGHVGEMAYASGKFASVGDAQTSTYVLRNTTTNTATPTELFLDGSTYYIGLASDRTFALDILVVAQSSGGDSAGYTIRGVIKDSGGVTGFVGTPTVTELGENVPGWSVSIEADNTNDALHIKVTGDATRTIRWVATVRTAEVAW